MKLGLGFGVRTGAGSGTAGHGSRITGGGGVDHWERPLRIITLNGQQLRSIGAGIRRLLGEISCLMRARPFSRAVPVLAYGPKWRPRHGHECGPCLARARRLPGRAMLGPGFSVSCLGRPSVPGPFGKVYTGGVPVAGAAKAWETARLERQRRGQ